MSRTKGFPPIVAGDPKVLILGSLPSTQSIAKGEYYGNPRNAFWPIMGQLFDAGPELNYAERSRRLAAAGIAVWDVLRASVRPGSLDASIDLDSAVANDFERFFADHPSIFLVAFNGKMAATLFRRLAAPALAKHADSVDYLDLPSTSPAHAAMSFEEKLACWSGIQTHSPPARHAEIAYRPALYNKSK